MDFMLAQRDRDAQDLTLAIQAYSDGDQDGCIPGLPILTHFLIAGIQEHIWEFAQGTVAPVIQGPI